MGAETGVIGCVMSKPEVESKSQKLEGVPMTVFFEVMVVFISAGKRCRQRRQAEGSERLCEYRRIGNVI